MSFFGFIFHADLEQRVHLKLGLWAQLSLLMYFNLKRKQWSYLVASFG